MPNRTTHPAETAAQRERVADARHHLKAALNELGTAAKMAVPSLDLDRVRAAVHALDRAEEALDIAVLDLATAEGEDA